MLKMKEDTIFDKVNGKCPILAEAAVFGDDRGSFSEVLVGNELLGIK